MCNSTIYSQANSFYNIVKQYTAGHNGFISGAKNIIDLCTGQFSSEQIKIFCELLRQTRNDFKYEELGHKGYSVVQTIWIT